MVYYIFIKLSIYFICFNIANSNLFLLYHTGYGYGDQIFGGKVKDIQENKKIPYKIHKLISFITKMHILKF